MFAESWTRRADSAEFVRTTNYGYYTSSYNFIPVIIPATIGMYYLHDLIILRYEFLNLKRKQESRIETIFGGFHHLAGNICRYSI